jgi:NAD(P)H-flavin reductase
VDTRLLKDSFALVAPQAAELAEYFYAQLFWRGGQEVSDMFPPLMSGQRDRLLGALVRIVTDVDDLEKLGEFLAGLGRDHRKFDVKPEHYDLVGAALLATLEHYAGEAWTPELKSTWAGAYALVAKVMQEAAAADSGAPPWWDATVTSRELRAPDVAVIGVQLDQHLGYLAGQSVAVQFPEKMARVWRFYSPAGAPDGTGRLTFHVKAEDGGLLSSALAMSAEPGSRLRLGPPVGNLKLDTASQRDILMLAGSTGLAPLLAILEEVSARPRTPAVHLFFGARTPPDLYALPELEKMAAQREWLTVTHAVSAGPAQAPGYAGEFGSVVDVAARQAGNCPDRDAYVCGSSPMTQAASGRLQALGMPAGRIHVEDFGWEG